MDWITVIQIVGAPTAVALLGLSGWYLNKLNTTMSAVESHLAQDKDWKQSDKDWKTKKDIEHAEFRVQVFSHDTRLKVLETIGLVECAAGRKK